MDRKFTARVTATGDRMWQFCRGVSRPIIGAVWPRGTLRSEAGEQCAVRRALSQSLADR